MSADKLILFHGLSPAEAQAAMRAVKAALNAEAGIAFAMTTETNRQWKVDDLIEHVLEEHRSFNP